MGSSATTQQCCVWIGTAAQLDSGMPARELIGSSDAPVQGEFRARPLRLLSLPAPAYWEARWPAISIQREHGRTDSTPSRREGRRRIRHRDANQHSCDHLPASERATAVHGRPRPGSFRGAGRRTRPRNDESSRAPAVIIARRHKPMPPSCGRSSFYSGACMAVGNRHQRRLPSPHPPATPDLINLLCGTAT